MTFGVKSLHYYLLIKVKPELQRRVLNTQIIQKTISKHHIPYECSKTSKVEYISLKTVFLFYLNLNFPKFELQYEQNHKRFSVDIEFYNNFVPM